MKPLVAFLAAGLLLPVLNAQSAGAPGWLESLHLTASGTASSVDNISRTSHEPSRKDAETYELNLASSHARQLAPSLLVVASGEVATVSVPDYDLNNNVRATGRLVLQRKFGLGPQATVLQHNVGAT